jgi:hypothetical protein
MAELDLSAIYIKDSPLSSRTNSGKSLIKANKTYSVSVLAYSFGVMNWTPTDLKKIPTSTLSLLIKYRFPHLTSMVERVTLPRKHGDSDYRHICPSLQAGIQHALITCKKKAQKSSMHKAVCEA